MYLLTKMKLEFSKKKPPEEYKALRKKTKDISKLLEDIEEQHTLLFNNNDYENSEEYVKLNEQLEKIQGELFSKEEREAQVIYDTTTHMTFVEDVTGGIVIDGDVRLAGSFDKFLKKLQETETVLNIID